MNQTSCFKYYANKLMQQRMSSTIVKFYVLLFELFSWFDTSFIKTTVKICIFSSNYSIKLFAALFDEQCEELFRPLFRALKSVCACVRACEHVMSHEFMRYPRRAFRRADTCGDGRRGRRYGDPSQCCRSARTDTDTARSREHSAGRNYIQGQSVSGSVETWRRVIKPPDWV